MSLVSDLEYGDDPNRMQDFDSFYNYVQNNGSGLAMEAIEKIKKGFSQSVTSNGYDSLTALEIEWKNSKLNK